ncbi:MAG TPA: GntR family transcriptional regulator [Candidatus Acidoferrales bacterium]|nr:GntR family transcriptional regulator [Candidatus Acidoferrales bacterium]
MTAEPMNRDALEYRTKVDATYELLRGRILSGRLKPGEKLDQSLLATQMRVSRTPLRQALLRLAAERLIETEPHRSAIVAPLSLIEIEDLYESRRVLESMLAGVGTERISERGLNQLRRVLDMQETAVKSGNPDRFADLDREFHFVLYRAAGYARAFDITQTLRDASERYVRFYTVYKGGAADSLGDHRRILQLCVGRDVQGVRDEVERHIVHGMETLRHAAGELNAPVARTESDPKARD